MFAYGHIKSNPAQATDLYTKQCAVSVNAKDLAVMAATLADGGRNPLTKKQVMRADHVPQVLAVMATAGLYDDSGKWLYTTGLPAKSGVGGGIIAVSPGKFGIAVISPPLDAAGNSVRAQKAIADISNALGGNPYAVVARRPSRAIRQTPLLSIAGPFAQTSAYHLGRNSMRWLVLGCVSAALLVACGKKPAGPEAASPDRGIDRHGRATGRARQLRIRRPDAEFGAGSDRRARSRIPRRSRSTPKAAWSKPAT